MRYIVDLSQNQANEIDSLIKKNKYQSVAQFVTIAVENQIYIERGDLKEKPFIEPTIKGDTVKRSNKDTMNSVQEQTVDLSIPSLLPKAITPPSIRELACFINNIPEENCWLWGQVNKIFPIKIGLRVLLSILESQEMIELELFKDKAADSALIIGKKILNHEDREGKKRADRISAGLPIGKEEYKSKSRYKGHFLAFIRKDGLLDGALAFLRFVNLKKNKAGNIYIGLTEAGLKFAQLENPVIDRKDYDCSLDEKEVDFYLSHVLENVKGEFGAIKWLLGKLDSGLAFIEEISRELKNDFNSVWNLSDAVINTQRSGLMARMIELKLIERYKKGVRVHYYISNYGKEFLKKGIIHG